MTETTKQTFWHSMYSLLEKSSFVPVICKLGSPNKQINLLTDEAKSKQASKIASKQPTNQPTQSHS